MASDGAHDFRTASPGRWGSEGDAMWAGVVGTSFWIDPKEELVAILIAQGPSTRIHTRMLYKDLVYGAMVH